MLCLCVEALITSRTLETTHASLRSQQEARFSSGTSFLAVMEWPILTGGTLALEEGHNFPG